MSEPPERRRIVRPPTGGDPAGRGGGATQRLKSAKERTPSSAAWLQRQLNDPFVAAARAKGYRSRAASSSPTSTTASTCCAKACG